MTAEELLDDLRRRGARLAAHSNVLHIEAPKGLLSPGLVASMRQLKPDHELGGLRLGQFGG